MEGKQNKRASHLSQLPFNSLPESSEELFHLHVLGQYCVTWPHLTSKKAGEFSLFSLGSHVPS